MEQKAPALEHEPLWTAQDVATYTQLSLSWVRHHTAAGNIPCVRILGTVRYDPDTIRAWATGSGGGKVVPLRR